MRTAQDALASIAALEDGLAALEAMPTGTADEQAAATDAAAALEAQIDDLPFADLACDDGDPAWHDASDAMAAFVNRLATLAGAKQVKRRAVIGDLIVDGFYYGCWYAGQAAFYTLKAAVHVAIAGGKLAAPYVAAGAAAAANAAGEGLIHVAEYIRGDGTTVAAHDRAAPKFAMLDLDAKAMPQLITTQSFRDPDIIAEKQEAEDYIVLVSPEFDLDGVPSRVVLDGHHSLAAAIRDGVEPILVECCSDEFAEIEGDAVKPILDATTGEILSTKGLSTIHGPDDVERLNRLVADAINGDVINPILYDGLANNGAVLAGVHRYEANRILDEMGLSIQIGMVSIHDVIEDPAAYGLSSEDVERLIDALEDDDYQTIDEIWDRRHDKSTKSRDAADTDFASLADELTAIVAAAPSSVDAIASPADADAAWDAVANALADLGIDAHRIPDVINDFASSGGTDAARAITALAAIGAVLINLDAVGTKSAETAHATQAKAA